MQYDMNSVRFHAVRNDLEQPCSARPGLVDMGSVAEAYNVITRWDGYQPTPLLSLPGLAGQLNIGAVICKNEAGRFGLGSFKALGGAYAVWKSLQARGNDGDAVRATVATASDGNHGLSVAWGARRFGCDCVVFLHEKVSPARADLIEAMGARIVRVAGNYDDSTAAAAQEAAENGWILIADTTTDVHDAATHDIMAGYGVMIMELQKQLSPESWPTHVLVQGGCGGLAAAVFGPLWALSQGIRPRFVVVEPATADCLYRSGVAGQPEVSPGSLETVMAGLSVGEVSVSAWPTLKACVDGYLTIPDRAAMETMRAAADGSWGDAPFVVGDSGSAGLAGLQILADLPAAREHLALGPDSRVLVFLTEGAVDLPGYERIVGRSAASVGQGRTL